MKSKRRDNSKPQYLRSYGLNRGKRTGVCFDDRMTQHQHEWSPEEQECSDRINRPFKLIEKQGLLSRCARIPARHVTYSELSRVHSKDYIEMVKSSANMSREELYKLSSNYDGVFFNSHTWEASSLAVGSVTEMAYQVASGKLSNGLALVRPPGHHAMYDEACGYCIFNNVAVAAASLLDSPPLSVFNPSKSMGKPAALKASSRGLAECRPFNRILIIDWDVHQGQGTQYAFYNDNRVLFISIHRYECQKFWPNLREGDFDFIGDGAGRGYNINFPLNKTGMTDGDYLAIFYFLIMPIAYEFDPEIVFVSSGFDAALGDPEGKMCLSPFCYGHMTHQLRSLAGGKLVVVLEGGYFIDSLEEGCVQVLRALLGDFIAPIQNFSPPSRSVQCTISSSVMALREFWNCLNIVGLSRNILRPDISRFPPNSWPIVKEIKWPEKNPILPKSVIAQSRKTLQDLSSVSSKNSSFGDIVLVLPASTQSRLEQLLESFDLPGENYVQHLIYQEKQLSSKSDVISMSKKKVRSSENDPAQNLFSLSKSVESAALKLTKNGYRASLIAAKCLTPGEIISTFNQMSSEQPSGSGEKRERSSDQHQSVDLILNLNHPKVGSSLSTSSELPPLECLSRIFYIDLTERKELNPSVFNYSTFNNDMDSSGISILAFNLGSSGSEVSLKCVGPRMNIINVPLQCCKSKCKHAVANVLTVLDALILPMTYEFAPGLLIINVGDVITKERAEMPRESLMHVIFLMKNVAAKSVVLTQSESIPDDLLRCLLDGSPPAPFKTTHSTISSSTIQERLCRFIQDQKRHYKCFSITADLPCWCSEGSLKRAE